MAARSDRAVRVRQTRITRHLDRHSDRGDLTARAARENSRLGASRYRRSCGGAMAKRRKLPRYKQEAEAVVPVRHRIPADTNQQAPNNSYGPPVLFYEDIPFTCCDCGAEEVWTAEQQKWSYEVAKGAILLDGYPLPALPTGTQSAAARAGQSTDHRCTLTRSDPSAGRIRQHRQPPIAQTVDQGSARAQQFRWKMSPRRSWAGGPAWEVVVPHPESPEFGEQLLVRQAPTFAEVSPPRAEGDRPAVVLE